MAGNSQRRGRTTGAHKKGASGGTGGKNRRSLAGRGATPPADEDSGRHDQRGREGRRGGADDRLAEVTDGLVRLALEQRQAARARRDYAAADAIRDQLTALGVQVEDTPAGPRWELSR